MFLFSLQASICLSFSTNQTIGKYKHKLTVNEIPSHNHDVMTGIRETSVINQYGYYPYRSADKIDETNISSTYPKGGDASHNNIQPSIVVNMWKRVS